MKLVLIRHAETVDNVAGLYAGVRDSALTIHGVEQARRLGEHFASEGIRFDHIFCSPLTRTRKTAEAIHKNQVSLHNANANAAAVEIIKVPDLIEMNFGSREGTSWSKKEDRSNDPDFEEPETKDAMAKRADNFLDEHLLPLLLEPEADNSNIAVVSHGMLLSTLWKRLLLRLPRKSLTIASEVTAARGNLILEHLGGWSNTGYLELRLQKPVADQTPSHSNTPEKQGEQAPAKMVHGWSTTIIAIDSRQHLVGLKRQRGGLSRLADDGKQKKLDGFFKRQKTS